MVGIKLLVMTLLAVSEPVSAQATNRSERVGEPLIEPAPPLPAGLTFVATDHGGTCRVKRDVPIASRKDVTKGVVLVMNEFQQRCEVVGATIKIELQSDSAN